MKFIEIIRCYILGFMMLMFYYLGDILGVTTWAFAQNQILLLLSLTLWYGTWLLITDKILKKVLGLD